MPTNPNMVAIQTVTVGAGGASSIDFTSIPQTYTDLKVVFSVRDATNNNGVVKITFNGSATGYTARQLYGTGSSAASNTDYTGSGTYYGTEGSSAPSNATASTFSNCELYIPNYTSSNNKSISADSLYENNGTLAYQSLSAGLWSNSAAITSIKIAQFSGNNFAQYSSATLYGVTSAQGLATGGFVTSDANYYYHTFLASGTFTPLTNLTVDYLVVAGGGGNPGAAAGGGGAGGLRCTVGATGGGGSLESQLSLTANTAYTVTIGGGGSSGAGSNSVFGSITATGGGAPGLNASNGSTGGSGGGGGYGASTTGGAGTANQGYAGGTGVGTANDRGGGGGGGAGAVGGNGNATGGIPGNGGNGVTTSISGTSTTYAGGGGAGGYGTSGGAGGTGGGGLGSRQSQSATAGTANTGGGGGGSYYTGGGAGGSGIVIVRYAK